MQRKPTNPTFPFGGDLFLTKEKLWPHLPELVDRMLQFYGGVLPDFITAHYADGGYAAALAFNKTGIPFFFYWTFIRCPEAR